MRNTFGFRKFKVRSAIPPGTTVRLSKGGIPKISLSRGGRGISQVSLRPPAIRPRSITKMNWR